MAIEAEEEDIRVEEEEVAQVRATHSRRESATEDRDADSHTIVEEEEAEVRHREGIGLDEMESTL